MVAGTGTLVLPLPASVVGYKCWGLHHHMIRLGVESYDPTRSRPPRQPSGCWPPAGGDIRGGRGHGAAPRHGASAQGAGLPASPRSLAAGPAASAGPSVPRSHCQAVAVAGTWQSQAQHSLRLWHVVTMSRRAQGLLRDGQSRTPTQPPSRRPGPHLHWQRASSLRLMRQLECQRPGGGARSELPRRARLGGAAARGSVAA